jgi:hypothetical protein
MKSPLKNRGQSGFDIVRLAVSIMVGLVVIGYVYTSLDQTNLPASASLAINSTLTTATTGFTLLAVGIIVAAAAFIINILR